MIGKYTYGHETGNLVAHALGRHKGDLISHTLVVIEVKSELAIVALDDHASTALHSLCADTTLQSRGQDQGRVEEEGRTEMVSMLPFIVPRLCTLRADRLRQVARPAALSYK